MNEEKKIAEIKKLHSLKQRPLPITYINRKYTYDEFTNEIFHSRLNKLPDDVMREIYKIAFTECFHEIRSIIRHEVIAYNGHIRVDYDWVHYPYGTGWSILRHMTAEYIIHDRFRRTYYPLKDTTTLSRFIKYLNI
jgi:hypothetical protein